MNSHINPSLKLIEEYFNDIISRIKYLELFCKNLKIKNFTSETPIFFSTKILSVCEYFENTLPSIYSSYKSKSSTNEQKRQFRNLLFTINENLKELCSHVRFAQSAQTRFMPYSLIKPIEKEIAKIEANVLILFRPQWSYNYMTKEDFLKHYNDLFNIYKSPNSKIPETENKPDEQNKKLFVISFPSIERKNILLHCLLGHELGHVFFSTKKLIDIDKFNAEASVEIRKKIPEDNPKNKKKLTKAETEKISQSIEYIYENLWKSGFEEIFSDLIGTLLFGPSFLFAQFESIFQNNAHLDDLPMDENYYYPPWRTRLRYTYGLCNELKFFPIPSNLFQNNKSVIKNINKRIDSIEKIIAIERDKNNLYKNEKIKIAYEQIFSSIRDLKINLIENFKKNTFNPDNFYNKVEYLVYRINNGVTPNEIMNSQGVIEKVNLFEIIAAGWFYKIGFINNIVNPNKTDETYGLTETNNRLILKAIEYSYLTEEYNDFLIRRK